MRLNVGDIIRVVPYDKAVKMYKSGKFADPDRKFPTNTEFIYGIFWNDYEHLCKTAGEVIEKHPDGDYSVDFSSDGECVYDIPPILISNKHRIELPEKLFEL